MATTKKSKKSSAPKVEKNPQVQRILEKAGETRPNVQAFVDWIVAQGGPEMDVEHTQIVISSYKHFQKSDAALAYREEVGNAREQAAAQRAEEREQARKEREARRAEEAAAKEKAAAKSTKTTKGKSTAAKESVPAASKKAPAKKAAAAKSGAGKTTAKKRVAKKAAF